MPLPILSSSSAPTPADLLRLFLKTELDWTRQMAEETPLEVGTAMTNPQIPRVFHANRIFDVALPDGVSPAEAFEQVQAHYRGVGSPCWSWIMSPSAAPARTQPMIDHLLAAGHFRQADEIMHLGRTPPNPIREIAGLTIIPARASYPHIRQLMEESAAIWNEPQLVEGKMLHLDDPHTEALLALRGREPVGYVEVLAVGEIGCVADLFVSARFRREGIGRTMMSRALEACARSLFRHVFICVGQENDAARSLYEKCGFGKSGEFVAYQLPVSR
jgi:ribosomal protein S18 acetylase RimI-like enzyme